MKKIITIKSQLKHLTGLFIALPGFAVLFLINSYSATRESYLFLEVCTTVFISITLFIHFQYLYINLGEKVLLTDHTQIVYYQRNGIEKIIKQEDVVFVEKSMSYALVAGGRYILPTDNYYYQKINLLNGEKIIITSLLLSDYELFPDKARLKKRIIAVVI